jgi:hypothetical protein
MAMRRVVDGGHRRCPLVGLGAGQITGSGLLAPRTVIGISIVDMLKLLKLRGFLEGLEDLWPVLRRARWLEFGVGFGVGIGVGAVIVLLLIGFVVKFGARVFGQFVKHDSFPTVAGTVVFFSTIVPGLVGNSPTLFVGLLGSAIPGAYTMRKMAVEMRDNARKKDLPADTTTEAPPPTDVGGLPA